MKKIGIIGCGRFGQALIESLIKTGVDLIIIDNIQSRVDLFSDYVSRAMCADARSLKTLKETGIASCDIVIICIGDEMDASILSTVNCIDLGIKTVISRAISETHHKILKRIGADIVIFPDRDRAEQLAKTITESSNIYSITTNQIAEGVSTCEIPAPKNFIGKTLIEINARQAYGVTVLVIRHGTNDIIATGKETIEENDTLVIFGKDENIEALLNN